MDTHYLHRAHTLKKVIITSGDVYWLLLLKNYGKRIQKLLDSYSSVAPGNNLWDNIKERCKVVIGMLESLKQLSKDFVDEELLQSQQHHPTGLDEAVVEVLWRLQKFTHSVNEDVKTQGYLGSNQEWKLLEEMEMDFRKLAPLKLDMSVIPVGGPADSSTLQHSDTLSVAESVGSDVAVTLDVPGVTREWSTAQGTEGFGSQDALDYMGSVHLHTLAGMAQLLFDQESFKGESEIFAEQLYQIARTYSDLDPEIDDPHRKLKSDALTTMADEVFKLSKERSSREEE